MYYKVKVIESDAINNYLIGAKDLQDAIIYVQKYLNNKGTSIFLSDSPTEIISCERIDTADKIIEIAPLDHNYHKMTQKLWKHYQEFLKEKGYIK